MAIVLVCRKTSTAKKDVGDVIQALPADHKFSQDDLVDRELVKIESFDMEDWNLFVENFQPKVKQIFRLDGLGWRDKFPEAKRAYLDNGKWKLLENQRLNPNISTLSPADITALKNVLTSKATTTLILENMNFPFIKKAENQTEVIIGG